MATDHICAQTCHWLTAEDEVSSVCSADRVVRACDGRLGLKRPSYRDVALPLGTAALAGAPWPFAIDPRACCPNAAA